jgi:hypothetical protein
MTVANLTIVCTTASQALPAGSQRITFAPGSLVLGSASFVHLSFINVCTSQDLTNYGNDLVQDMPVSMDSIFHFELSNTCGQLKFRSQLGSCSVGEFTSCNFVIPTGLSYAEFSLTFFADAVSSGCNFFISSMDSYLRASPFPVVSVFNQSDRDNFFELVTYPTSLYVSVNPPLSIDTGQAFQSQGLSTLIFFCQHTFSLSNTPLNPHILLCIYNHVIPHTITCSFTPTHAPIYICK